MKIGLIGYNFPHLKSEQIFHNLLEKDYELEIFLLPFISRKKRVTLIHHRPDSTNSINLKTIGEKYSIRVNLCENDFDIPNGFDFYLILGSNILSKDCVLGKKIINCHPGLIPSVRGLDSFKFSIMNNIELAITLHFIDDKVDEGEIISTIKTPIYITDSLETLSRRHYENEIKILSNFEQYLKRPVFVKGDFSKLPPTMRMKIEDESIMVRKFDSYVESFS